MEASAPPSKPPTPPRLRSTDLPLDDASVAPPVQITEDTDISTLSTAQLFDLNQQLINDTVPQGELMFSNLSRMDELRAEYADNTSAGNFFAQIDGLVARGYTHFRKTLGNGDCFYRSLAFAYIERLMTCSDPVLSVAKANSRLESLLPVMEAAGFERDICAEFYDPFATLVDNVANPDAVGELLTADALIKAFHDDARCSYIVMYMRLLTSAQMRTNPDEYSGFLLDPETGEPMTPKDFCDKYVDVTGKEADHLQISALSRALGINLDIAYLDGRSTSVDFVPFSFDDEKILPPIRLLYRPGHYDVLLKD